MGSLTIQFQFQLLCFVSAIIFLIHFGGHHKLVTAQPSFSGQFNCGGDFYTNGSQFQRNLNLVLSSLSSNITVAKSFYNNSIGDTPDRVYGILLCRGDLTDKACKICAETAVAQVTERCPGRKEYITWYTNCMLRYSNRSIFSVMEDKPEMTLRNRNNVTNQVEFYEIVRQLMFGLVRTATTDDDGGGDDRFATGEVNFTSFDTIYGLVQCTPDISVSDCNGCLRGAVDEISNCCFGKKGGIILRPSCDIRYELYPFYGSKQPTNAAPPPLPVSSSPPPPANATTLTGEKEKKSSNIVLIVVIPLVIALILLVILIVYLCSRKKKAYETVDEMDSITRIESLRFDLATIRDATSNFSDANKLGKGGFGFVYKGRLSNGQEIAVKRLSINSEQGKKEFKTEVGLLVKLQHRNLVRLLGFCLEGEERLLIYEFVPNGSLDHLLFDPKKSANLSWETRYKIIGGIVRGVLYLHEDSRLRIVHRDIKAANVLLDEDMNAKISDFGMAKLFELDQTRGNSSKAVGTYGYIAPEYALHGEFSAKSDVYSFGVLLLEIITGRRINQFYQGERAEYLLTYVWRHWEEGTALELIDQTISDCYSENEVMRCIQIGLLSVQDVNERPTMASIVHMLTSDMITPRVLSPPVLFQRSSTRIQLNMITEDLISTSSAAKSSNNSMQQSNSSKQTSSNEVSLTEMHPR